MDRREFIAAAGTAAALASTSKVFAQAAGGGEMEEPMHPPKYKALEESSIKCVATGNDCLRHCLGMYKMKDTSMAGCADSVFQLVNACSALAALAAVNSEHTGHFAKVVEMIWDHFCGFGIRPSRCPSRHHAAAISGELMTLTARFIPELTPQPVPLAA